MKAIKLALVRQRYNPFGGAERFVERAMLALQAQETAVTIVTRRWNSTAPGKALICDPFYAGSLWRDWGFARCVCRNLEHMDFDLVQSHERIACCDIYRAGDGVHREWLAQRARILSPLQRLGVWLNPYHRYTMAAERRLFQSPRLRAVICISEMVKQDILRHFTIPEHKLHVIYNGIDTEAFHPSLKRHAPEIRRQYGIPENAPLFLFVGSGFRRKGLRTLLEAMRAMPLESHLLVVGKDKEMLRFLRQTERLGLGARVHFTGGQKDVRPCYGAADAFVFPTLYEPFGNVVLEAMASGLPVITSTNSGAAEMVKAGVNGYVCDALDLNSLQDYMRQLLDRERRQAMGLAARRAVEPMTLERMGQAMLRFYGTLLNPV